MTFCFTGSNRNEYFVKSTNALKDLSCFQIIQRHTQQRIVKSMGVYSYKLKNLKLLNGIARIGNQNFFSSVFFITVQYVILCTRNMYYVPCTYMYLFNV